MTKNKKLTFENKQKFINVCTKNGFLLDRWGNLTQVRSDGKEARIKFKELVARYEVRASDGGWVRIASGYIKNIEAYQNEKGFLKLKNFVL